MSPAGSVGRAWGQLHGWLEVGLLDLLVAVERHGNTSAASIPLALDEAVRDGRIQRGQHLLLEGVGGGFTWGSVLLQY